MSKQGMMITVLGTAIDQAKSELKDAIHGSKLDHEGLNRDEDGLNCYPNLEMIKCKVEKALSILEDV